MKSEYHALDTGAQAEVLVDEAAESGGQVDRPGGLLFYVHVDFYHHVDPDFRLC